MKKWIVGWLEIAMAVLACVGMWGCCWDDEVTVSIDDGRTDGMLVAFLDDSLVVMKNFRGWEEHAENCDYNSSCDKGSMNQGIFLVNYRQKQSPYWGDTAKGVYHIMNGFAYDSTVFFYTDANKFGFWKIREPIDVRGKLKWSEECHGNKNIQNVRPWKNGNVLLEGAQNCPYAILDTITGIVKKLDFSGENAWLKKCDDISYVKGNVVCLKAVYSDSKYGVYKYVNDELSDSLIWKNAFWADYTKNILEIRGYMFTIRHPSEMINQKPNLMNGVYIHPISPMDTSVFPLKLENYTLRDAFVDSSGSSVSYFSDDLIVVK